MTNVIVQNWWAGGSGDGLSCDTNKGSWDRKVRGRVRFGSRTMIVLLEVGVLNPRSWRTSPSPIPHPSILSCAQPRTRFLALLLKHLPHGLNSIYRIARLKWYKRREQVYEGCCYQPCPPLLPGIQDHKTSGTLYKTHIIMKLDEIPYNVR